MFHIQVIGGKFKGLKLESDKNEKLRPTKDRVKESIFDILQFQIINKKMIRSKKSFKLSKWQYVVSCHLMTQYRM